MMPQDETSQPQPPVAPTGSRQDRRHFLKNSALAGSTILASAAIMGRAHAAGDEKIRVGVVGCGGRGMGAMTDALTANPNVRIVALADLFPERMSETIQMFKSNKRFADRFEATQENCYDGFDCCLKLLAGTEVDVVVLTAPPHYRPDHLEACVNADKHVFCEKPIAVDAVGVRRVRATCEIAEKKGLNIVSGLCWRYDAGVRETIARLQDGAIGRIVTTQANYLTGPVWSKAKRPEESEMEYQCRNWYYYTWLSGDHVLEQFIHSLDKALWLRGDVPPLRAYGTGGRQTRNDLTMGHIYDHFCIVYEWADGTRTFADTRQFSGCKSETEDYIFGTEGTAKVLAHAIDGPKQWKFSGDKISMYVQEHMELYEAIEGKRPTINNGGYMCDSTIMGILGREVCYSGQELTWDQVVNSPQDLRPAKYEWGAAPEVSVPMPGQYRMPLAV
jgi:myo-inositol 2-dehydrogenase / D-chiro-inositol 1-dehydrogenase